MKRWPVVVLLLGAAGCVTVKPWQREHLSRTVMDLQLGDSAISGFYRQKVMESRTGGGLPGTAPGGGCGCTQ